MKQKSKQLIFHGITAAFILNIFTMPALAKAPTKKHAVTTVAEKKESTDGTRVSNPFAGAAFYLNPDYQQEVADFFSDNPDYLTKAKALGLVNDNNQWIISTAVWLDNKGKITNNLGTDGHGIQWNMQEAYAQAQKAGKPVVITFVVYDLPNRDCDAWSSNGEIKIAGTSAADADAALDDYKTNYVDQVNRAINSFYASTDYPDAKNMVRTVLVVEPDSLPNMITNSTDTQACTVVSQNHVYQRGIAYALHQFSMANTGSDSIYMYLDIAHSGWLGWSDNANKIATIYNTNAPTSGGLGLSTETDPSKWGGFDKIQGLITNTANYTPLTEAFSYDDYVNTNNNIISSDFYQWNNAYSEQVYISELMNIAQNGQVYMDPSNSHKLGKLTSTPFYNGLHFLIDTSRNGWHSTYEQPRYDARDHRGNWCNVENITVGGATFGASFGAYPQSAPELANLANPSENLPLDAYVWIKPPGESDGNYDKAAGGTGDLMCEDGPGSQHGNNGKPTDSLQDLQKVDGSDVTVPAPHAGSFFARAFEAMIDNSQGYVPPPPTPTFTTSVPFSVSAVDSHGQSVTPTTDISVTMKDAATNTGTVQTCTIPAGHTTATCDIDNSDAGNGETFTVSAPSTVDGMALDTATSTQSIHFSQGQLSDSKGVQLKYAAVPEYTATINVVADGVTQQDTAAITLTSNSGTKNISVPVNGSMPISLAAGVYHVTAADFTDGDNTYKANTPSDLNVTSNGATETITYVGTPIPPKPDDYTTSVAINVSAKDDSGAAVTLKDAVMVTIKDNANQIDAQTCTVAAGTSSSTCAVKNYDGGSGEIVTVTTSTPSGYTMDSDSTSTLSFSHGVASAPINLHFTAKPAPKPGACTIAVQYGQAWGAGSGTQNTMNITVTNGSSTTIPAGWVLVLQSDKGAYTSIANAWNWKYDASHSVPMIGDNGNTVTGSGTEDWQAIQPGQSQSIGMNINSSYAIDYASSDASSQIAAATNSFEVVGASLNGQACSVTVNGVPAN